MENVIQRELLEESMALKHVRDINKKRLIHYKYYTGRIWGLSKNYNLCLDVSSMNAKEAVEMIKLYLNFSPKKFHQVSV